MNVCAAGKFFWKIKLKDIHKIEIYFHFGSKILGSKPQNFRFWKFVKGFDEFSIKF